MRANKVNWWLSRRASLIVAILVAGCQAAPNAELKAAASSVHEGEKAAVTVTVTANGQPRSGTKIDLSVNNNNAGSITPASGRTLSDGTLPGTFKGGPVNENTDVIVTAAGPNNSSMVTIEVRPLIVTGTWPLIVGPPRWGGDVVTITPSVTRLSDGKTQYEYEITVSSPSGASPSKIKFVSVTFESAVDLQSSPPPGRPGSIDDSNGPKTVWTVKTDTPGSPTTPAVTGWTSLIVTATTEKRSGGKATFEVLEDTGGPLNRVSITVVGPLP